MHTRQVRLGISAFESSLTFPESIAAALHQALHVPISLAPSQKSSETPSDSESEVSSIIYIGGESLGLTNLLITHSTCNVCFHVFI
jgi:hypothetical protein